MSQIALRKRLLIAESDLHRARLMVDVGTSVGRGRAWIGRTSVRSALVALGATAVGMWLKPKSVRGAHAGQSENWIRATCNGVNLLAHIWTAIRPRRAGAKSTNHQP
ncbi:MAG: hypothetical protein PF961_07180 [Planctomycetota bacterium]|jgi:hypothetical protein|nr:hypothetical protein [Planctomycetota bacterium]